MLQGLIWQEPKNDEEALRLLRAAGELDCRGYIDPGLFFWLSAQEFPTVARWFTAYRTACHQGTVEGAHELGHAFRYLAHAHPALRSLIHVPLTG